MPKNLPDFKGTQPIKISKSRKWLFSIILIIFIPISLFLLLELGLRIWGYGYPSGFFIKQKINGQSRNATDLIMGKRSALRKSVMLFISTIYFFAVDILNYLEKQRLDGVVIL